MIYPKCLRWILGCAAAETIGIGVAAAASGIANRLQETDTAPVFGILLVIAAGAVEGFSLGAFQALALRSLGPKVETKRYVVLTVAAAIIGWGLGLTPSLTMQSPSPATSEPPALIVVGAALALGVIAGLVLAEVQWRVLGRAATGRRAWLTGNAAGWGGAMAVIFIGATNVPPGMNLLELTAVGALTGALAGLVLGTVSAIGVCRLRPN